MTSLRLTGVSLRPPRNPAPQAGKCVFARYAYRPAAVRVIRRLQAGEEWRPASPIIELVGGRPPRKARCAAFSCRSDGLLRTVFSANGAKRQALTSS
jgi:hypothetical protein